MFKDLKIGLVIQGPLLSRGRTGKTANIGLFKVTNEDIVNYDCVSNVTQIYSRYRNEFHDFICVTWDTEDIRELENKIGKNSILPITDTTKLLPPVKGTVIPGNNKYRQFLSTLKGLEHLAKNGCEYAFKIRTDQGLNLSIMKSYFLEVLTKKKDSDFIIFPAGNKKSPDQVDDFYFAAKTDNLINICKMFLEKPELYDSVHKDLFFKSALFFNKGGKFSPNASYTSDGKFSKEQQSIILTAWLKNFVTFPRSVYENLTWRGEKFPNKLLDNLFFDDINPVNLKLLILSTIKIKLFPKIYMKILKWRSLIFKVFKLSLKNLIKRIFVRIS